MANKSPGKVQFRCVAGKAVNEGPSCWWYPRHSKFFPKAAKDKWGDEKIYPETDRKHPTVTNLNIMSYSLNKTYKLPDPTKFESESFNDLIHRTYRVVEAASRQNRDVIMTSHCDLVNLVGAYPLYTAMYGKREEMHDNCMPHPDKKEFPWFGFDQLFKNKDYVGKIFVSNKGSTFTLTFEDPDLMIENSCLPCEIDYSPFILKELVGRGRVYPKNHYPRASPVVLYNDDTDRTTPKDKKSAKTTPKSAPKTVWETYAKPIAGVSTVVGAGLGCLASCLTSSGPTDESKNLHGDTPEEYSGSLVKKIAAAGALAAGAAGTYAAYRYKKNKAQKRASSDSAAPVHKRSSHRIKTTGTTGRNAAVKDTDRGMLFWVVIGTVIFLLAAILLYFVCSNTEESQDDVHPAEDRV